MDYSFPDQDYSNYFFPDESYNFSNVPTACPNGSGIAVCNGEILPFFNNNEQLNMLPLISSDISSPIFLTEQLGVSDMAMQALPKDYKGFCDFGAAGGAFESRYQHELREALPKDMAMQALPKDYTGFCDFGAAGGAFESRYQHELREASGCSGLVPNLCQAYPGVGENWGIQGKPAANVEETATKVGRYSIEERKDRIQRYLKKRNQRNFKKTIKYACRKTLADKRIRVRGRFAKNNEPNESENEKKTSDNYCEENNTCYDDSIQIKYDDGEDLLEAAMSSLVYFPYISS